MMKSILLSFAGSTVIFSALLIGILSLPMALIGITALFAYPFKKAISKHMLE